MGILPDQVYLELAQRFKDLCDAEIFQQVAFSQAILNRTTDQFYAFCWPLLIEL